MCPKVYKILIDARSMRKDRNGPSTYAVNMLQNLAKIDKKTHYTIIVNNDYVDFIDQDNFTILPTQIKPYRFKEHWAIHRLLAKNKFDLFHSLQYIPPFGFKCPLVMTIYDTMHMDNCFWKGSFFKNMAGKYARLMARYSMQKADSVITISKYSAKQIEQTFQYPADKIFPIYLGVDYSYSRRNHEVDFKYSVNKWNIPSPYLLCVGNMKQYKNVNALISAFAELVKSGYTQHVLVLAGKADESDIKLRQEQVNALSIENKVIFLRGLNNSDLKSILGGSSIFIFPSREEGFGLPLLEAMSAGVPCIASNIEVLKEIAGDAPLYFDLSSKTELKEKVLQLILSEQLRNELSAKGLQRAENFTWKNTAKQTLAVYNKILTNNGCYS